MRSAEGRGARALSVGALSLAIVLGLSGCGGLFATPAELPTLYVGAVEMQGHEGHVLVSVVNMPAGGLAAIQLGEVSGEAIALGDIDPTSVSVEGKNGFVVLAEAFDAAGGAVIAANGTDGVMDGDILRFSFAITGGDPTFVVERASVTLASDEGEFVETWSLKTAADAAYIARSKTGR
ncbi:MAG: hypothetical protein PHU43_08120 [Candidatus Bipolaricaulis sp.]|nr:hypothetical protein [Candidatus Bipolaricaulis sp.]